jgi:hypothetical protein
MVELVQSTGCAEEIIQQHLGNPPHFHPLNLPTIQGTKGVEGERDVLRHAQTMRQKLWEKNIKIDKRKGP